MQLMWILLVISLASVEPLETWYPAKLKETTDGYNAVCTEDYCDTLDVPEPGPGDRLVIVTSSESGERFKYTKGIFSHNNVTIDCDVKVVTLTVNHSKLYRSSKIFGFGGAFTGSVSYILSQMSVKLRAHFYNSYFSREDGARYNLLRVPIGCSDFDLERWAYNLYPENDKQLTNFTKLDARDIQRNQQIKEMKHVTGRTNLQIVGCAWTSPPWMKAKNQWEGNRDNQMKPEYYQTWANYHAKWAQLMISDGMPIWGLSTGNEPAFSRYLNFSGLSWQPANQSKWLVEHLAPTLQQNGLNNVQILGYDDTRLPMQLWLNQMHVENKSFTNNIDVLGVHGYFDANTSANILNEMRHQYELPILYTEMSFQTVKLGSWSRAEELADILMTNLQHNVIGYIDWNLILDQNGGPNLSAPLDACIIVNDDFTAFEKQPMFYVMAHFSRFIPPGSIRIDANICGEHSSHVQTLAYLRCDSNISVILFNRDNQTINLTIRDSFQGETKITLKAKSITTIVYSTKRRGG